MRQLMRLSRGIDAVNEALGKLAAWMVLLLVCVGVYNTLGRYIGRYLHVNLSSNGLLELQWYLFSFIFLLAAAYTLRHNAHVRVDVIYSRVSDRTRSWINLIGILIFLFPFCLFILYFSWPAVEASWAIRETSPDPGGLPRYPVKLLIPIGFLSLLLQGFSEAIKEGAFLLGEDVEKEERPMIGGSGERGQS